MLERFLSLPIVADSIIIPNRGGFGERKHPILGSDQNHDAIDIDAVSGTPILAVLPGKVLQAGKISDACGYGIVIAHKETLISQNYKYLTSYCHMNEQPRVSAGDDIQAGKLIGFVGNSGRSTNPHLHFKLREITVVAGLPERQLSDALNLSRPINPTPFLQGVVARPLPEEAYYTSPDSNSGISPFISSLQSFHPKIQYELIRRSVSSETANTYMPFVKLTALMKVSGSNFSTPVSGYPAWCPSLGIHGEDSVTFEDIYSPQPGKSIIAHATTNNPSTEQGASPYITVPVYVADASKDAKNIPMPGITKISAERGTAGPMGVRGGLFKADVSIVAYSVGQVDALLKYFLRPATRVVLELGRKSSNKAEKQLTPYNWKQKDTVIAEKFQSLIRPPKNNTEKQAQQEFIEQYIYGNNGNYEIFIAYVVKFNLKYNKDNTYTIDLTLHSVQQFEVPTKHTGVRSLCADPTKKCYAMDIQEYFDEAYSWKENSFTKLMGISAGNPSVITIRNSEPEGTRDGAGSTNAGTRENEYFVTWDFFVQRILNDPQAGIRSLFGAASTEQIDTLSRMALLQSTKVEVKTSVNELYANEVGYHPALRSVSANVMVINNPVAQRLYKSSTDKAQYDSVVRRLEKEDTVTFDLLKTGSISSAIENGAKFTNRYQDETQPAAGWLGEGVWLNTTAIKQAFTSTDTVSTAISSLLNMMSAATEGYWNLQLYSTDSGMYVIDMGLSKPIAESEEVPTPTPDMLSGVTSLGTLNNETRYGSGSTPNYIYVFNRGFTPVGGGEVGSDVLDVNIEFNLPQVVAVQAIAGIGGPAQKSVLQSINVEELNDLSLVNKNLFVSCVESDICADDIEVCRGDELQNIEEQIAQIQSELSQIRSQPNIDIAFGEGAASLSARATEERLQTTPLENRLAELETRRSQIRTNNPNLVNVLREYAHLGTALQLIELNPSRMMKLLNRDSLNGEGRNTRQRPISHAFNSSNLTKTIAEVTIPGIGGINLFQSFLIDRVPSILERGFYVVTKITHEFSPQSGWLTKVQGRFRFRPETTSDASQPYNPCDTPAGQRYAESYASVTPDSKPAGQRYAESYTAPNSR